MRVIWRSCVQAHARTSELLLHKPQTVVVRGCHRFGDCQQVRGLDAIEGCRKQQPKSVGEVLCKLLRDGQCRGVSPAEASTNQDCHPLIGQFGAQEIYVSRNRCAHRLWLMHPLPTPNMTGSTLPNAKHTRN